MDSAWAAVEAIFVPLRGIGSSWGRVTSTYRSPQHNRRVGGVRNSWHMHGRAIDIARKPGVSHSQIAAAFRNAGYRLIESLDEGDHSHFAFAFGGSGAKPHGLDAEQRRVDPVGRGDGFQRAPALNFYLASIFFTPRAAWRRRCSFSTRAMRT